MSDHSRVFIIRDEDGIKVWYNVRFVQTDEPQGIMFSYNKRRGKYERVLPKGDTADYVLYRCVDDPTLISAWDYKYIVDALNSGNAPLMPEVWYPQYKHMTDAEYENFARRYDTIPLDDFKQDLKEAARHGKN